ncbi:EexN family lipoprotein (plasmid) [Campylobacter fetus subsp. venerealis bv. intermedius]|uniref:EexN family lipoprotein n=1 Tax=Campylobacter fetus TaxID=196 RepID=UPI0026E00034|nr:EexN family lipoprotein [Campylobacter fetus]WKW30227.1 EexN family lipoprotein [Campylobacter fetus subsp. venerealis bv. intermedius]
MTKIVAGGILVVGLLSLTGCFEQEIKTTEYFKTHPDEMAKVIIKCKKRLKK